MISLMFLKIFYFYYGILVVDHYETKKNIQKFFLFFIENIV